MRSVNCTWNENLIFDESFDYIKSNASKTLILFHLKDLPSKSKIFGSNSEVNREILLGWKTLGWAFLNTDFALEFLDQKLCVNLDQKNENFEKRNKNLEEKSENINQKGKSLAQSKEDKNIDSQCQQTLKLQLYRPRKIYKVKWEDVFNWWKIKFRPKYQISLQITIKKMSQSNILDLKNLKPHRPTDIINRSKSKASDDKSNLNVLDFNNLNPAGKLNDLDSILDSPRIRKDLINLSPIRHETPYIIQNKLPTFNEGCTVLKFSNNGNYLACGTSKSLIIFDASKNFEVFLRLRGHTKVIYDLCWSENNLSVISCSGDCTVRLWSWINMFNNTNCFTDRPVHHQKQLSLENVNMMILKHPAFVYSVRIFPKNERFLVTGSYDCILRIWNSVLDKPDLLQEIPISKAYITSLCFNDKGNILYSGHSNGKINVWKVKIKEKMENFQNEKLIKKLEALKIEEINKKCISHICYRNKKFSILITLKSDDIGLVLYDLKQNKILNIFKGQNNQKLTKNCFSHTGDLVFNGSIDGTLKIWSISENCETFQKILPDDSKNSQKNSNKSNKNLNFEKNSFGILKKSLENLSFLESVSCVNAHPHLDVIAVGSFELKRTRT